MLLFCGTDLCSVYFYKYLELNHLQREFIDYCYSLLVTLLHFGTVGRMATRPVVLPEVFNGEGSWHQWIFHSENVAAVNEWNEDSCLRWMKVRLTGRAQTAFQRFPQEVATDYKRTKEALQERFEPSSRRERYQAQFQT